MATTVADQFAEVLAAAGVKRIYGIVGDSLNGLTDSLRRQGKIEWIHVRHEEVAAFAAGAGDEHDVSAIASAATVAVARPVALTGHRHPIPGFPAISPFPLRVTALCLRVPANVIMG